jgi:hypothetical protein
MYHMMLETWEDSVDVGLKSALKMETVCFSNTLVFSYKSTKHYNPEDQQQHLHQRENFRSYGKIVFMILG